MQEVYSVLLSQGIGAPSEPMIHKGDKVKRGQLIAKCPEGKLGSNIHASVTGTVKEVTAIDIKIKANKKQSEDYEKLISKEPLERIKEAGLVGLGGAGFPTYVKLSKEFKTGGIVIVNAAECEPILSHNIEYIQTCPEKIIRGLKIAMEMTNAKKGAIAIKEIHPEAMQALQHAIDVPNIRVEALPNMYPMGEERAIVREILGKVLPVEALPMEANAIIINAETAYRIAEAVDEKKPLIDKDLTVSGKIKGAAIQTFFNVPIGTTVREVIEKAGGLSTDDYGEIIMGGPFTGSCTSLDSPIVKTTGGILVAEQFWKGPEKLGLLVCACGGNKNRLEEIAKSMGSEVVGVEYCKQAIEVKNTRKCENPGRCPGQVGKVMALKKAGAQAVLISNCTDCSTTVMSCAPALNLPVYHCTDGALRAVNMKLIRKFKGENKERK